MADAMFHGVDSGWMQAQWRDCADKAAQSCNTHHEKLIEVAVGDGNKFKTLQQRICHTRSFVKHPHIKVEPCKLS